MTGELKAFRRRRLSPAQGQAEADRYLEMAPDERHALASAREVRLDDPETLLPLFETLRNRGTTTPREVLEETEFLYEYIERLAPRYPVDAFLLDEREYFLGEVARIAGTLCRELSRRDEARRWLDLADGWFLLTENASGNLAKVGYQRLALRTEERDFSGGLELLPQLTATFEKLGMHEDALKSRFLEVMVFKETDRLLETLKMLRDIASQAKSIRNDGLLAHAYVNLVQVHGILKETDQAVAVAKDAAPLLRRLNNHVGLAKLHWGIGYLQRGQKNLAGAIEAFRSA